MKRYVHVYTGEGKGKTTAALGLALRSAGAGHRVFIAQFMKGMKHSELDAIERFSGLITLKQYGRGCFILGQPKKADIRAAKVGFSEVKKIIESGQYEVVILDEATVATYYRLLSIEDVLELIRVRPVDVELVITGRYADSRILDKADLVTEMVEVKHYYRQGVAARVGIDK
jgi:cob(I)alamin adenosyltransferase